MAIIKETRGENSNFDIIIPDNIQEVYADGVIHSMMGMPNSKILFYTVSTGVTDEQMKDGVEKRVASLQLTIPVVALLELAQSIQNTLANNSIAFGEGVQQYMGQFKKLLPPNQNN